MRGDSLFLDRVHITYQVMSPTIPNGSEALVQCMTAALELRLVSANQALFFRVLEDCRHRFIRKLRDHAIVVPGRF